MVIGRFGNAVVRIQGEESFILHPDQAVIFKPGRSIEFLAAEAGWESAVLRFDCNAFSLAQFRLSLHRPLALRSTRRTMELMEQLWLQGGLDEETSCRCSEIIFALLLELKMQSATHHHQRLNSIQTTQQVLDFIHENYNSKLTLAEISRRFGYSPQHLNRLFKKELGCTVHQYMLKLQLEHAADMLGHEERTVEQIADEVGMEWRSFYRLFQRKYQVSPGEFRKKIKRRSFV
ncbi:AraC family transcriptional regulator [Paenibacillus sp. P26]|nr:AraC family transcriptional regulator [Paenibacillus sp. P26]UUZ93490.1 AraC family transcriptional regulator [Paenibacillus sp. P25]